MTALGGAHNTVVPVARILRLLAVAARSPIDRDEKLHDAILAILSEVGADALVFRVGPKSRALGVFIPQLRWDRKRKDEFTASVTELAALRLRKSRISEPFRDGETGEEYLFSFPGYRQKSSPAGERQCFFCFISGLKKINGRELHRQPWPKIVNWRDADDGSAIPRNTISEQYREVVDAYCAAIEMAMLRRAEADSIIAPNVSEEFWKAQDDLGAREKPCRPWEHEHKWSAYYVATTSLSFDLRSSTFIMEHAIDKAKHADWLEKLVKVLRVLTHRHNGVFDKFTGDGVLVHFPVYGFSADDEPARTRTVINAVACGWEMVEAAELCGEYLRPNLALYTERFGGTAGVAFDFAAWSRDEAGNPIVVGRGVVHACRLSSDRDDRMVVLATNAAFARLEGSLGHQPNAVRAPLVTKEYSSEHMVTKIRMVEPPTGVNFDSGAVRRIVEDIFQARL